jgi:hypothetical protein
LLGVAPSRASQVKVFRLTLEYAGGPGCPTVAEFRAVVAGRLGYDPFLDDMPDRVLVRVTPRRGAIDGRLEWRDSTGGWAGEQAFPSVTTDCARFARVVAFALAVQIQLLANVRAASTPADAAPKEAPPFPSPSLGTDQPTPTPILRERPPQPPPASVVARAPSPSPRAPRPVWAVGAGPSVGLGMSSSPILMGRILGVLAWTHVSLELAAEASLPAVTRRMDGAGFSQQHLLLGVAGCAVLAPWNACVVAKGGEVKMAGMDIDRPSSAVAPVIEAGLRVGAVKELGRRASLNAHVDGLSALSRWTATLDKVPVWSAPRFAAVVGVDAVVRFP